MVKKWIVLLLALALTGCGRAETMETVADEMDVPVMAQPRKISVDLPGQAEAAMETESGRLYVTDDYEIMVETLAGGDLNATVESISGMDADQLTVMRTQEDGCKRYEFVWACAGEGGEQLGRAVILDDGNYHYCLSVQRPAEPEKPTQVVWSQVFQSFSLAEESEAY